MTSTLITTCPDLLAAVEAETPSITVQGDALTALRRVAIQHNRPYSPFAGLVSAAGGLIGHIVGRDFASNPGGRQDVTLNMMSAVQAQAAGLTPAAAQSLITTLNDAYTITAKPDRLEFELPDYSSRFGPADPSAKYAQYLGGDKPAKPNDDASSPE